MSNIINFIEFKIDEGKKVDSTLLKTTIDDTNEIRERERKALKIDSPLK